MAERDVVCSFVWRLMLHAHTPSHPIFICFKEEEGQHKKPKDEERG
jgi:hypothetical protein